MNISDYTQLVHFMIDDDKIFNLFLSLQWVVTHCSPNVFKLNLIILNKISKTTLI